MKGLFAFAALASATAASALSFSSVPGAPDPGPSAGQQLVVTFDAPNAAGYSWTAGNIATAVGSSSAAATPAGDTTVYGYVSSSLIPNFATLTTPGNRSFMSFYWGSIDSYNSVDVYGPGNVLLGTISGTQLPPDNGNQFLPSTNRRVYIYSGAATPITALTFRSTGVAFEFDDIAASVPEPASWAMLIAGFGLVGATARRRRSSVAA